jgi:hypothetical protein
MVFEPLFEYGGIEEWLAASLGHFSAARIGLDVGDHRAIENRFPVFLAIAGAIQANDRSSEIKTNSTGDACHLRRGFAQQRRFIAIAGCRNKRCDHIAIPIAEGDDLVPFHLLVTAEPDGIATSSYPSAFSQ